MVRPERKFLRLAAVVALSLALCASAFAASPPSAPDHQTVELRQLLRKLQTTARLLHTTAHPDDEDGGMLTLESRGKGHEVVLLTLTRGEGGQNKMGSNLLDSLGVLRTLELLASDNYYGVEQRFTRVADFGFSKTADETLAKWHSGQAALADMVRVIRTFRPDVIVSRFQGTPRDGHGHHQASGILTRQAFRAAADPTQFPEQLREGLTPWQAKKLYVDNVRPFGSTAPPKPEDYTLALDTGAADPLLGTSYAQYAMQGLKHQLSQGAGSWEVRPGPHVSYYKLVDSVLPMPASGVHEKELFDGIDTSLPGLALRLGGDENKVPWLRPALVNIATDIEQAAAAAEHDPSGAAGPLLKALANVREVGYRDTTARSVLPAAAAADLYANINTKRDQLRKAVALALGFEAQAVVDAPVAGDPQHIPVVVPGQSLRVKLTLANHGAQVFRRARYIVWGNDRERGKNLTTAVRNLAPGAEVSVEVPVHELPGNRLTRPYWHRANTETDTIYTLDQPQDATLPFTPRPLWVYVEYETAGGVGQIDIPVEASFREGHDIRTMPVAVAPAVSVALEPATRVIPAAGQNGTEFTVTVQKNVSGRARVEVRLQLPPGWHSEPASVPLDMSAGVRHATAKFHVIPHRLRPGREVIKVVASYNGRAYTDGYTVITRADLGAALYYQPAVEHVSVVDVKVPRGLKVGYIMGAGDDIPTVLRQVGLDATELSEQDLASGDLRRFGTIVLGIRAYDTREDVRKYNTRLLDYAAAGGTMLVQYNSGIADFNSGHYTPYPAELSRERVSVEEAPVQILAPAHGVFHYPNQITAADFQDWVQERGLYFMNSWDARFAPLLEAHDPGEPQQKGGLLYAKYGKGSYIYTGYSFFRQLPAGVPGAVRLFVNLVSAGHESMPTD